MSWPIGLNDVKLPVFSMRIIRCVALVYIVTWCHSADIYITTVCRKYIIGENMRINNLKKQTMNLYIFMTFCWLPWKWVSIFLILISISNFSIDIWWNLLKCSLCKMLNHMLHGKYDKENRKQIRKTENTNNVTDSFQTANCI